MIKSDEIKLWRVIDLYYEQGLTQEEIGLELSVSRVMVSKMLKQAKEKKLVRPVEPRVIDFEDFIIKKYGLRHAVVVANVDDEENLEFLAKISGKFFSEKLLRDNISIAVGPGEKIDRLIKYISPEAENVSVVSLAGGAQIKGQISTSMNAYTLYRKFVKKGGDLYRLPERVKKGKKREALKDEAHREAYEELKKADIYIVPLGGGYKEGSTEYEALTNLNVDVEELRKVSVGHVTGFAIDENGDKVESHYYDHVIMLDFETTKENVKSKEKDVVTIAVGEECITTVIAGLRGGLFNTLFTDSLIAEAVVKA